MPLFSLGSNGSGQLSIGHLEDVSVPTAVTLPPDIPKHIDAGGNHTLICFADGSLFIIGEARHQIATQPSSKSADGFQILAKGVQNCSALWEASVFWDSERKLRTCGKGSRGELGRGPSITEATIHDPPLMFPALNEANLDVISISSSIHHTVVVLSNGEAYGWGNARKGQIGEPAGVVWQPRKIEGLDFGAVKVICGNEFTMILGESKDGRFTILGSDKWSIKTEAPRSLLGWKDAGAGWGSISVLLESGKTLSWGRNDHGQLSPANLPLIKCMAVGSEHTIAVSEEGEVLAWGWGEHGNCGTPTDPQGDVKNRWNSLILPGKDSGSVNFVAAGCATSWIYSRN